MRDRIPNCNTKYPNHNPTLRTSLILRRTLYGPYYGLWQVQCSPDVVKRQTVVDKYITLAYPKFNDLDSWPRWWRGSVNTQANLQVVTALETVSLLALILTGLSPSACEIQAAKLQVCSIAYVVKLRLSKVLLSHKMLIMWICDYINDCRGRSKDISIINRTRLLLQYHCLQLLWTFCQQTLHF